MLLATMLSLLAAVLHVIWNLVVKTREDQLVAGWAVTTVGAIVFAPWLVVLGPPEPGVILYIAASAAIHLCYTLGLAQAYRHGDLSVAYPVARGTAPLLTAIGGAVLLQDSLAPMAYVGIALASAGLILAGGRGTSSGAIGWAVITGVAIAAYTLVDAAGVRTGGESVRNVISVFVGHALLLTLAVYVRRPSIQIVTALRSSKVAYLVGGIATVAAYALVLTAIRFAPVAYVATLRESSVVVGTLAGWLLLHEDFGSTRTVGAGIAVAGIALLIVE